MTHSTEIFVISIALVFIVTSVFYELRDMQTEMQNIRANVKLVEAGCVSPVIQHHKAKNEYLMKAIEK